MKRRRVTETVTEAQARSGIVVVFLDHGGTSSNVRHVPYVERYHSVTGVTESPVERLQQAAEDEERRRRSQDGRDN